MKIKLSFDSMLGFLFCILPVIKLDFIRSYEKLDLLYDLWGVLSVFSILVRMFMRGRKISMTSLMLGGFCAIYCVMTLVVTPSAVLGSVSQSVRLMIVPLYIDYTKSRLETLKFIDRLSKFFFVILVADSVSVFANTTGVIQYSLMGLDNTAIFSIIPMLTVIMFNSYIRHGKINKSSMFIFLLCCMAKFRSLAVTSILSLFIMGMLLIIVFRLWNTRLKKMVNANIFFGICIAFTVGVLFFNLQNLFVVFFGLFGKDGTMSGRTNIWSATAKSIFRHPLLGYGQAVPGVFQSIVGLSKWARAATHTHNFILEIIWSTGLAGTVMYMYVLVNAVKKLRKYSDFTSAKILICGMSGFFILMITDSYIFQPVFVVLLCIIMSYEKIMTEKYTGLKTEV